MHWYTKNEQQIYIFGQRLLINGQTFSVYEQYMHNNGQGDVICIHTLTKNRYRQEDLWPRTIVPRRDKDV